MIYSSQSHRKLINIILFTILSPTRATFPFFFKNQGTLSAIIVKRSLSNRSNNSSRQSRLQLRQPQTNLSSSVNLDISEWFWQSHVQYKLNQFIILVIVDDGYSHQQQSLFSGWLKFLCEILFLIRIQCQLIYSLIYRIQLFEISSGNMQEEPNRQINHLATILNLNNQQQENMNPEAAIRAISMIFAEPHEGEKDQGMPFSPQARMILLTILLCATVLAMYTIFESFIDTIILAVLSGIAYVKLRQRFVLFMKKSKIEEQSQKSIFLKFIQTLGYATLIVIIPEIRYIFSEDFEVTEWKTILYTQINQQILSKALTIFLKANNIIKLVQLYLLVKIANNMFGSALQRLYFFVKSQVARVLMKGDNTKDRVETFLHNLFIIVFILAIILLVLIFAGLFFECSSIVSSVGRTIQKYNNCTFYSLENESDELSQCSSTITGSLRSYLPSIQRKDEVGECIKQLQQKQAQYLNFTLFEHKKEICLIYQIVKEQSPQAIDSLFDIEVTKQYLLVLLRNILKVLALTSDTIFSITTFISIFIMTVKSYAASGKKFRLFGDHQNELMGNIANLIYHYIMVTFKHIVFSLVIFEVFRFSDFNIVLSLMIGAVTLFPLISVTMVMLILSILKYYMTSPDQLEIVSAVVCLVVFWLISGAIFKQHSNKMDFNNTLVSLSAVFGLYRFGVAGIFYGPLVILLFICSYEALGKSKI